MWRRAGMAGAISGLDLAEAAEGARMLGAADEPSLFQALADIESGYLDGVAKAPKPQEPD